LAVSDSAIVIPGNIYVQIEREGIAAYPNECCGLLIGRDVDGSRRVEKLVPMDNVFDADEQYHRFTIDPLALAKADEDASKEGRSVIGFYHSHPDHPAIPSEYDRTHVPPWSFYSHVIVAIEKGSACAMTCWVMNEETEQFEERRIERK
jgi:proteasome lid subunit RPN8/RPN11